MTTITTKNIKSYIQLADHQPQFVKEMLMRNYPFTHETLSEYSDVLDWQIISSNMNIEWTI